MSKRYQFDALEKSISRYIDLMNVQKHILHKYPNNVFHKYPKIHLL